MNKRLFTLFILIFSICSSISCTGLKQQERIGYDTLGSAVTAASYAVIGEYGEAIPPDFTAGKFMRLIEKKIPEEYYNALKKYSLDLKPKGSYYLLLVHDPKTKSLILFDYSCTPEPDGPVLLEPEKYDLKNLELYDTCKGQNW
jgi:hypothetical protein